MAEKIFLRLTVCPRTILFTSGRTFYTTKTAVLGNSSRLQNKSAYYQMLRRSICMSRATFPTMLQITCKKKYRLLDRSSCSILMKYSYSSDSDNRLRGGDRFDRKVELKEHTKYNMEEQTDDSDTELKTILTDLSKDFEDEFTITEIKTGVDGEELKKMKVADASNLENLDSTNVNKKNTDFEYDYQVAEDIEEYDYIDENKLAEQQIRPEKVLPISLTRGQNGVFDLDELVTLLEDLGAENIVTFPVPPSANFCDHMVVVSAKSRRHLQAINDELLWVHKRKKSTKDHHLIIEGLEKSTWCAMDMGNIVLHVFYGDTREYYNIESLWTLGPDHDPLCQESSVDPYALSPEDLFWLETGKAADKDQADTTHQDDSGMTSSDVKLK